MSSVHLFLILCSYTCGSSSLSFPLISSPPLPPKLTRTYRNMRPTLPSSRKWEPAWLPGRANGAVALCGALPLSLFPAPCGGRVTRARRRKEPLSLSFSLSSLPAAPGAAALPPPTSSPSPLFSVAEAAAAPPKLLSHCAETKGRRF